MWTATLPRPVLLGQLPLALTTLRALLAPMMLLLAFFGPSRFWFGLCLTTAFLSDIFDGIIARRLGVATPDLRRLDSVADTVFYLAAALAAWHLHPAVMLDHRRALAVLAALEAARYAFDLRKFGREASYHMWSSKLWGIGLFAGFLSLLSFGSGGIAVVAAIYLGIVADIEGLAISVLLADWKGDVPSVVHARRLRSAGVS